jgi:hypothetical protein
MSDHPININAPLEEADPKSLIAAIRGGIPETCSFCGTVTPPEHLHPEEGGDWACITCLDRWDAEDAAEAKRISKLLKPLLG